MNSSSPAPDATVRGHRTRPHTADLAVEAWGPSRGDCLAEAVRALAAGFAEVGDAPPPTRIPLDVQAEGDDELLVRVLEEFLYVVDALGRLPIDLRLDDVSERGAVGYFETVPVEAIEVTGAVPKGISRSGLVFGRDGGQWRCHVLVDV